MMDPREKRKPVHLINAEYGIEIYCVQPRDTLQLRITLISDRHFYVSQDTSHQSLPWLPATEKIYWLERICVKYIIMSGKIDDVAHASHEVSSHYSIHLCNLLAIQKQLRLLDKHYRPWSIIPEFSIKYIYLLIYLWRIKRRVQMLSVN